MEHVNNEENEPVVDGFSDTVEAPDVDAPDRGFEGETKPLSPEEYRKAQEEARRSDHKE